MEYLQRDLDKLARWCAKCRMKLNPEKTEIIIFSKSQTAKRAEPALYLYGDLLSYYLHIKFPSIIFDNRMTFTKHFEEILERCKQKFHRLRIFIGQQKVGSKPHNHFTNLQTMCKTNIRIWDCFYYNCFGNCHHQNTESSEIFHQASLPKYVSARLLLHEASGLLYVRERFITVGQNHLARMHQTPSLSIQSTQLGPT